MNARNKSTKVLFRILIYSAFGITLWLKFKASHVRQLWVVSLVLCIAVIVLNYYTGRLLRDRIRLPGLNNSVIVARSTTVWILVFGILGIFLCDTEVVWGGVQIAHGRTLSGDMLGPAWLAGFIGMLFIYAGGYELRITKDAVSYLSLFDGYRSLTRAEIDHATIRRGWYTPWDRFKPTNRLELIPDSSFKRKPIIVNLKAFRERDVEQVLAWLGEKLRDHQ